MNRQFLIRVCVVSVFLSLLIEKAYCAEGNSINENYPIDLNKIQGGTSLLSRSFYFIGNRGWKANDDLIALKTADSIINGNFDNFFLKTKTNYINLGLVNSYYWFKINFENRNSYPLYRYIKVNSRELADIRVFVIVNGKVVSYQKGGRFVPVSERPYFSINHIFPIKFPPSSESIILIRVYSPIILWITFHTSKSLQEAEYKGIIPLIIFFGIFIAVFFYNLFLAISLKDKTYVYYLGHAFFLGLFFFLTNGFISLLLPTLINASPQLILTAPGISVIFYLLFTSSFLETRIDPTPIW